MVRVLCTGMLVLLLAGGPALAAGRSQEAAAKIYAQQPDLARVELPGQPDSTLVRRLIYYHTNLRGRPGNSRVDWQFTLADYLGYNQNIDPTTYPDNTGSPSALERDKQAIDALSRRQRNRLIDLLTWALQRP